MRPQERKTYYRQVIARVRSKDPAAAAVVAERRQRDLWDGRDRAAAIALIMQAAKDCSRCTVCAGPLAAGQSVTLRRCDVGQHFPSWVWAPVCLSCTLTRVRERPWPWSDDDHPSYDGFRRFRCRGCGRPLRVSAASWGEMSPTCCEACQRQDRNERNNLRRRVKHKERICENPECPQPGRSFIPTRSDQRTCSNACRQAVHRAQARQASVTSDASRVSDAARSGASDIRYQEDVTDD